MLSDLFQEWAGIFQGYGDLGLFVLAFIESSFFPVPPDILIIAFTIAKPESWAWYATVSTVGSVLGAGFGYLLGNKIGEPLLERIVKKETIMKGHGFFEKYGEWAILIAAFTPIPYKVFTILAGILGLDLKKFFVASIIGRAGRFFLIGYVTMAFGKQLLDIVDQYILLFTVLAVIAIVAFFAYKFRKQLFPKFTGNPPNEKE